MAIKTLKLLPGDGIGIEVAVQYTDAYNESVYSFANTINTVDGGTHLTGLRAALRDLAQYQLRPLLSGVDGVARVQPVGGDERRQARQGPHIAAAAPPLGVLGNLLGQGRGPGFQLSLRDHLMDQAHRQHVGGRVEPVIQRAPGAAPAPPPASASE